MALSLLAGYSSEGSDSDSDDGISVVIHKNPQPKKTSSHNDRSKPVRSKRPAPPPSSTNKVKTKFQKTESVLDNAHNPEYDEPQTCIPLPSTVLTMFDKTEEQEALDQWVHGGRVRSFPHEKNNWASFVYIDVSDLDLDDVRNFIIKELELEPTEDTHVSLSRTVSLRHHWIDPIIQGVTNSFKEIERFTLKLDKLQVYCNDQKTRTFVGLESTGGIMQLNKLSKAVDRVFRDFSLPSFYYPPSFHVSLGWCLGNKTKEIRKQLESLDLKMLDVIEDVDDFGKVFVKEAHCKSGNRFFDFKLK